MKLPPLNALRAFDSAAKYQSFILAAKSLHVSAASVSRYIKLLEEDLGHPLFNRYANGIKLTVIGEQYYQAIQFHLSEIAKTSQIIRQNKTKETLRIVTIPAIAETFLVNNLWRFQQNNEDIQINLILDNKPYSFIDNEPTVWITPNDYYEKSHCVIKLPKNKLGLVCTPQIAKTISSINDIKKHTLLVDIDWDSDWKLWSNNCHLDIDYKKQKHLIFERYSMVINAVIAGTGVALGHLVFLSNYLKMEQLVMPFNQTVVSDKQFYIVTKKEENAKSVTTFIDWLYNNLRHGVK